MPKKQSKKCKNQLIRIRVTEQEYNEIKKCAEDKDKDVSKYMLELHRNRFRIFDVQGLVDTLHILYPKKEAERLEKQIRGGKNS